VFNDDQIESVVFLCKTCKVELGLIISLVVLYIDRYEDITFLLLHRHH